MVEGKIRGQKIGPLALRQAKIKSGLNNGTKSFCESFKGTVTIGSASYRVNI